MKRVLVVLLLMGLALPASAHSEAELEAWLESHNEFRSMVLVMLPADRSLFLTALDFEYADWVDRHPCSRVLETWTDSCAVRTAAPSGHDGSSAEASAPAPRDSGMGAGVEQWRSLVEAHFAPDQVWRALCIMGHESGGNPNAKNPRSSAAGLFQFLKSTWDSMVPDSVTGGSYSSGQVYDPAANVAAAAWLSSNVGWSQWSPYQRGLCR